jgi:hypothetical protein
VRSSKTFLLISDDISWVKNKELEALFGGAYDELDMLLYGVGASDQLGNIRE